MNAQHKSESKESEPKKSGISTKTLVRILIAVGIGIPILIESFTLFELFNIHIFSGEKTEQQEEIPIHRVIEGSQILPGDLPVLTLEHARVWAEPEQWIFEMEMEMDGSPTHPFELTFNQLVTTGEKTIDEPKTIRWEGKGQDDDEYNVKWSIPPGETPLSLTVTLKSIISQDSTHEITREVKFGKIPVQYRDEEDED